MRPTRAIIHLDHLRRNLQAIRRRIGGDRAIAVAVKANAYGHGAVRVADVLTKSGADWLGVALAQEGEAVRRAGITAPIMLYSLPNEEELEAVVRCELTPLVAEARLCRALAAEVAKASPPRMQPLDVHLKVDTGMGRIGCQPEEAPAIAREIAQIEGIRLTGTATHLADSTDDAITDEQLRRFRVALDGLRGANIDPGIVHAANSGAVLQRADLWFDMVRPGIMVYGYHPDPAWTATEELAPVMSLETRVSFVKRVSAGTPISYGHTWHSRRPTTIITLPVGYGDGYRRLLSNRATVLLCEDGDRGRRRAPVVGRICMDQMMVDAGPDSAVKVGDRAILFGPDRAGPDASELAIATGTIAYEITCGVNERVPRVYRG